MTSLLEHLERLGVAEELRHADQQILVERFSSLGSARSVIDVLVQAGEPQQLDAALDAAADRGHLVEREVDAEVVAQQPQHRSPSPGPR